MYCRNNPAAVLALVLSLHVPLALASVYRCADERNVVLFSQYPCATADNTQTIVITNISVVAATPLTKSEQATLERIQRQYYRNKADNLKDQQRTRQRTEHLRAEHIALCARARDSLKRLRKRRRGGYSLSTAGALDAEQTDLKSRVSQFC
jgi:hypothetical protein